MAPVRFYRHLKVDMTQKGHAVDPPPIEEPLIQHIAVRNSSPGEGTGILSGCDTDSLRPLQQPIKGVG